MMVVVAYCHVSTFPILSFLFLAGEERAWDAHCAPWRCLESSDTTFSKSNVNCMGGILKGGGEKSYSL